MSILQIKGREKSAFEMLQTFSDGIIKGQPNRQAAAFYQSLGIGLIIGQTDSIKLL
ncbi:hypothetical protein [Neisseria yangbaofengii]|uniref:hypothetical protein n=1 Tax=Neisseria yangbaofengii TaxID=2709396 RepID=UPI0013EB6C20|nr:hypothetical protein [Neisseria yangbaofengii]